MALYKLVNDSEGNLNSVTKNVSIVDGAITQLKIPLNPDNTDYQEYLEWAQTNTAEAAD